jgi:hypothetical protein
MSLADYSELKKIIDEWIGDACDYRDDSYDSKEIAAIKGSIDAYKNVLSLIEELEREYEPASGIEK